MQTWIHAEEFKGKNSVLYYAGLIFFVWLFFMTWNLVFRSPTPNFPGSESIVARTNVADLHNLWRPNDFTRPSKTALLLTHQPYENSLFFSTWENIAQALHARAKPIGFAAMNCRLPPNAEFCDTLGFVEAYPAIVVYDHETHHHWVYEPQGKALVEADSLATERVIEFLIRHAESRRVPGVDYPVGPTEAELKQRLNLQNIDCPAMYPAYVGRNGLERDFVAQKRELAPARVIKSNL